MRNEFNKDEHRMLTERERVEIEEEMGHGPRKEAACIEALKIVQRRRGWVDDEDLRDVAQLLGMSPDEVDGVATFYNLIYRRPVGRHVILLCDSVSCWLLGYEDLLSHLRQKLGISLGGTTADGMFTLLPVPCLGACDRAPAMMIDETLHVDLTVEKLDAILNEIRQRES